MVGTVSHRSWSFKVTFILTVIGGLALLIAPLVVPRETGVIMDFYDRGLEGGPDSFFHHIYDPNHLLGPMGQVDFDLDNFQTSTNNVIIFAAFEAAPTKDPMFTLLTAERWAPGARGDDRGVVIFVFMKERRIRAEIGYGLEENLTDIAMGRILNSTMIPLLREGKPMEAVESCARELRNRLTHIKGGSRAQGTWGTFFSALPTLLREFKRRAGLIIKLWTVNSLIPRLIMSTIALLLWASLVNMIFHLALAMTKLFRFVEKAWLRRDMEGGLQALTGIVSAVLRIVQMAVFVLIIGAGTGYFFGGSGMFGGGGVNVFW
jgi:uncharacterized membrane protein YgcG